MTKCILIPCYDGAIDILAECLSTVKQPVVGDIKIFIALSNERDEKTFRHVFSQYDFVDFINTHDFLIKVAPTVIQIHDRAVKTTGIINIKKFVALKYLFECGYEYVLCADCDMRFVGDLNDIFDRAIGNYQTKKFFGVEAGAYGNLPRTCISMFHEQDRLNLSALTNNGNLYTWFHDIPTYSKDDYVAFEEYMVGRFGSFGNFIANLRFATFDHLMYSYFLILHKGFSFVDYSSIGVDSIPEGLTLDQHLKIKNEYGFVPVWCKHSLNDDGLFLIHNHTDR